MPQSKRRLVKCNKCDWVHLARTRKDVLAEIVDFNVYFDSLTRKEQQAMYGGKRHSIKNYENCSRCGNRYTDFSEVSKDSLQTILINEPTDKGQKT